MENKYSNLSKKLSELYKDFSPPLRETFDCLTFYGSDVDRVAEELRVKKKIALRYIERIWFIMKPEIHQILSEIKDNCMEELEQLSLRT